MNRIRMSLGYLLFRLSMCVYPRPAARWITDAVSEKFRDDIFARAERNLRGTPE